MTVLEQQQEALSYLISGITEADQLYYAKIPSSFLSTSEEGIVSFMEHFSYSISIGSATLSVDVYLDPNTKVWHIEEHYSMSGKELWSGQALMNFNTTTHKNNQYFCYALISDSTPEYPELPMEPRIRPIPDELDADAYSLYLVREAQWTSYEALLESYPTRCAKAYSSSSLVILRHTV